MGHETPTSSAPPAIDPEHDMDAKVTIMWLTASFVFVVICLLVLFQSFGLAVANQRGRKVEQLPTVELRDLRAVEDYYLKNPAAVNADGAALNQADDVATLQASILQSTDRIIEAYVNK